MKMKTETIATTLVYECNNGDFIFFLPDGRLLAVEEAATQQGDMLNALLTVSDWAYENNCGCEWITEIPEEDTPLIAQMCNGKITLFPQAMGVSGRLYAGISAAAL